uniref:hypothetical protein n=1 Tax=Candidatus Nitrotoga sp. M5 TaxID=2890409 RepID=UPI001EF2C5CE|nr:hypothetical protein [Candidatus Nitrotoga sp. M5]
MSEFYLSFQAVEFTNIAKMTLNSVNMPRSNNRIFSEPAIAFQTRVPGLSQIFSAGLEHTWLNEHPRIYQVRIHLLSNSNYPAAAISALYPCKLNGVA